MNEIIKVEQGESGELLISARDLHEKLEMEQRFTDWFKYQSEKLGIIENEDFITILGESTGGRPGKDYLT